MTEDEETLSLVMDQKDKWLRSLKNENVDTMLKQHSSTWRSVFTKYDTRISKIKYVWNKTKTNPFR